MGMNSKILSGLVAWIVPLIALCALSVNLAHPSWRVREVGQAAESSQMLLARDAHMNRCFTIFLRQQYQNVAKDRQCLRQAEERDQLACTVDTATLVRDRRVGLRLAVADYNLIAQEADFGVFNATHLPASVTP